MKKVRVLILCAVLVLSCGTGASAASGRFSIFLNINEWSDDVFEDVSPDAWYTDSIKAAYGIGIAHGDPDGLFRPEDNITMAEALKLACCLHKLYETATTDFDETQGDHWYDCYVEYGVEKNIISENQITDYSRRATRAEFAQFICACLPTSMFNAINTVQNNSVPDLDYSVWYAPATYMLYRAGILAGSDEDRCFCPDNNISRAEAMAIIGRIADEDLRQHFTLTAVQPEALSGEDIFAKCSDAVFYIEMFDASGAKVSNASGFFIDSNGTAVTCWHVLEKGVTAKITLANSGEIYNVTGIYDFDMKDDWAIIKIDGSGFSYLDIGDESTNVGGATVYAMGSPLGLQNSITQGLICNPTRIEEGTSYVLFSSAISNGSSGGALINKYGQVIGITAATYVYGQNLNLAVKISYLDGAQRAYAKPLSSVLGLPDELLDP